VLYDHADPVGKRNDEASVAVPMQWGCGSRYTAARHCTGVDTGARVKRPSDTRISIMAATRNRVMEILPAPPPIAQLLHQLADPMPDEVVGHTTAFVHGGDEASWPRQIYSVLVGALPFAGSIDMHAAGDVARAIRSRRAELVTLAASLQALKAGGRAALVVPESLLEATTRGHLGVRRMLIEEHGLQAVIALRAGLFKPRTRAAILLFVRGGRTRSVWYDTLQSVAEIPQLLARWQGREQAPANAEMGQGFWVGCEAFAAPDYALGIARAHGARPARATVPTPEQILHEIASLEAEILQGIRELVGLLR
jgi:hypothetical protein